MFYTHGHVSFICDFEFYRYRLKQYISVKIIQRPLSFAKALAIIFNDYNQFEECTTLKFVCKM